MEYILKSTAILTLFYVFYKLFLQNETFFQSIRGYFLIGITSALAMPLIVITKYITVNPINTSNLIFTEASTITRTSQTLDWLQFATIIYLCGVLFFGIRFLSQLSSIFWFLYTHSKSKKGKYILVKTTKNIAPFSFFNYIVYNQDKFDEQELEQIFTHEKVHANQLHSFDIILSQIIGILNWFNPFIWLYNKEMQKNLEFTADQFAQKNSLEKKKYQYLLLKTISPDLKMALTSNFYNSLIKKRIDMLQKNRSNKKMQLKFALIIPILIAFVFTFNTKTIAQTTENKETKEIIEEVEISNEATEFKFKKNPSKKIEEEEEEEIVGGSTSLQEYIITKNSSKESLEKMKKLFGSNGITLKFKGVKRNEKGEITAIKISVHSKKSKANYNISSSKAIDTIQISLKNNGENISINRLQQNKKIIVIKNKSNNIIIGDTIHLNENIIIKADNAYHSNMQIVQYDGIGKNKPLIIVNGLKIENGKIDDIDVHTIHSVTVLKGESSISTYGEKGKNGVILVTTKHSNEPGAVGIDKEINKNHTVIEFTPKGNQSLTSKEPLHILDGKEVPNFENLNPDSIQSIDVIKGKTAIKKYGEKAKNGVIKVTTKKD